MLNLLLFTAEHAKAYYPASEIPDMLAAFLPLVTRSVYRPSFYFLVLY